MHLMKVERREDRADVFDNIFTKMITSYIFYDSK